MCPLDHDCHGLTHSYGFCWNWRKTEAFIPLGFKLGAAHKKNIERGMENDRFLSTSEHQNPAVPEAHNHVLLCFALAIRPVKSSLVRSV